MDAQRIDALDKQFDDILTRVAQLEAQVAAIKQQSTPRSVSKVAQRPADLQHKQDDTEQVKRVKDGTWNIFFTYNIVLFIF